MSQSRHSKILQTVAWEQGRLRLIDQNALPGILRHLDYTDWREVVEAIRTMIVRGAPAIGCTAALGIAMAARRSACRRVSTWRSA